MSQDDLKEQSATDASQVVRDGFSSKSGFITACIGSAVGMGNIWLFSYRVGQFGGAAFLIPYFFFVIVIGLSGVIGEMSFGRAMKAGPLGAFTKAIQMRGKSGGSILGMIPVIGSLGIATGYAVVVGWLLKFTVGAFDGGVLSSKDSGAYFGAIVGPFGSVGWHVIILVLVFLIMVLGISKGIEIANKIMMPLFFVLFIGLAIYVVTLPGAIEGYKYLFIPKWNLLADLKTWIYALGQAFFSLSLAGSGTLVYGSYLKKSEDVVSCAKHVAFFDTLASLLAAIVIIPAVFAFGLNPGAGPPLMFITMPSVFKLMFGGQLVAIIFFVAVLFAGTTSLMNLLETPIEALQQKFKISRVLSATTVIGIALVIGVMIENAEILGRWMDLMSLYIVPLGALLAGIMFFWVCGSKFVKEQVQMGRDKPLGSWFVLLSKYVFCGLTLLVLILSIVLEGGI